MNDICSRIKNFFKGMFLKHNNIIDYYNEAHRLQTFKHWKCNFIDKNLLARTGFIFTEVRDLVTCQFCNLTLGEWDKGEDVILEHLKWSPYCPLMTGKKTDNIPISWEKTNEAIPRRINYRIGTNRIIMPKSVVEQSANISMYK